MSKKHNVTSLILLIIGGLITVAAIVASILIITDGIWNHRETLGLYIFDMVLYGLIVLLILSVIFHISGLLNRKFKNKAVIMWCIVFSISYIAAPFIGYGVNTLIYNNYYTFSIAKWRSSDPQDRGRLIDSFLDKYDLLTFSRDKVEEYLGEPDKIENVNSIYVYDLGDGEKLFSTDMYLSITFDTNQVIDYSVEIIEL